MKLSLILIAIAIFVLAIVSESQAGHGNGKGHGHGNKHGFIPPGHRNKKQCPCPRISTPVCGSDNVTYTNDCERKCQGTDKAHDGACKGAAEVAATTEGAAPDVTTTESTPQEATTA